MEKEPETRDEANEVDEDEVELSVESLEDLTAADSELEDVKGGKTVPGRYCEMGTA